MTKEFVSLHDKIKDEMIKRSSEVSGVSLEKIKKTTIETDDVEQIKQALNYILEKLTSLDRYVRNVSRYNGEYRGSEDARDHEEYGKQKVIKNDREK